MLALNRGEGNFGCVNLKEDGSSKGRRAVSFALTATRVRRNPPKVLER